MRVGIHVVSFTWPALDLIGLRWPPQPAAEDGGQVKPFSLMDHWFQMEAMAPANDPMLEGYTLAGFAGWPHPDDEAGPAGHRVTYRHPGLLAKIVTTLDVLSAGASPRDRRRLVRTRASGPGRAVPAGGGAVRTPRGDAADLLADVESEDDGAFEGRHYRLAETICEPPPQSQPRPPVLIGVKRRTKRRCAWSLAMETPATRSPPAPTRSPTSSMCRAPRHCEAEGRDPDTVQRTILAVRDPSPTSTGPR